MYLNLDALVNRKNKKLSEAVSEEKEALNKKDAVDYEAVNNLKWKLIKQIICFAEKRNFFFRSL